MAFHKEYWARRLRANFRSFVDTPGDYRRAVDDDPLDIGSLRHAVPSRRVSTPHRAGRAQETNVLVSRRASEVPRRIQSRAIPEVRPLSPDDNVHPSESDAYARALSWTSQVFGNLKNRILSVTDTKDIDFHLIVIASSSVLFLFGAFFGGIAVMMYALVLDFRRNQKGDR